MSWFPISGPLYALNRFVRSHDCQESCGKRQFQRIDNIGALIMRAAIALAGCFLISSSVFAAEPQLNDIARMRSFVVALAKMPPHKSPARIVTRVFAIEIPMERR